MICDIQQGMAMVAWKLAKFFQVDQYGWLQLQNQGTVLDSLVQM